MRRVTLTCPTFSATGLVQVFPLKFTTTTEINKHGRKVFTIIMQILNIHQLLGFVLCINSQSSSLIKIKAVLGSPFMAFQVFAISGPKLNSAMKSSSNSSTLSFTMVKLSNADWLAGVKTKSLIVLTTSGRPDSALKSAITQYII